MNDLIEIYESMIQEPKEEVILDRKLSGEPTIYDSILTPQDGVNQAFFGHNLFQADEEGMKLFISKFQGVFEKYPSLKLGFPNVLPVIFYATIYFFGEDNNHTQRKSLYKIKKDDEGGIIGNAAKLSDFMGKGCAECSEKAVAVQNLLMILAEMGVLKQEINGNVQVFHPSVVLSKIQGEPHAFNMLRDPESKKSFFVDNHYWVNSENGNSICAIYSLTEDEYQRFMQGKKISPRLVTPGTQGVKNEKVVYGVLDDEVEPNL